MTKLAADKAFVFLAAGLSDVESFFCGKQISKDDTSARGRGIVLSGLHVYFASDKGRLDYLMARGAAFSALYAPRLASHLPSPKSDIPTRP